MTNILDVAKDYLRRGWQPLPIPHRSKNPNFPGWQNLKLNESDLVSHFNGKPQNVGVLLGAKSNGLTDVDIDSYAATKIAHFFLPKTEAVFGRKSKPRSHWIYRVECEFYEKFNDPFLITSQNEEERKNACILEIRAKGGLQTVFPGSTHESGEIIEWQTDGEPTKIEIKDLRQQVSLLSSASLISRFWKAGTRQDITLCISGAFLRNGFTIEETENFIKAVCNATNDGDIQERLNAVRASAERLQKNETAYGFPKLVELTDKKLVETICKWLQIELRPKSQVESNHQDETQVKFLGKPKPLDLTLKPVETITDESLPEVLLNWVKPASKVIGCPFDFLVLSAIVIIGSLIGSRLRVKPLKHSDWFVVANLYGGIVGLPSTKKTPALDETRKPILELQAKARKEFSDKIKDFEIEAKYYERETTAIYREKLDLEATKTKINGLPKPEIPILQRHEINDITTPKMAQFLSENPKGLVQNRDELIGWFKSLEADYDLNARSFILELWKGAIAYELARVGNGEILITSGTLSIIGGIQPSKLQKYIAEAYSFDNSDGLPQRFIYSFPDVNKRPEKATKADYIAMQRGYKQANEICKKIAEFDFKDEVTGANGDKFQVVKFSSDAQAEVDEWQPDIEAEAESLQIEDEPFSAYLYKLPKSCFAIALIFHCLEHITDSVFPDEITRKTTLKAIAYTEVLISHARRVFALGENQIFSLAQILIGKIKKGGLEQGFTAYTIKRKQWSGLKTTDIIKDVLSLLVDYGYLKELPTDEGRGTIKYAIHPSLETEANNEVEK